MRLRVRQSALVHRLAGALPAGATLSADGARQDVAERLGQLLSVVDAIGLSSAHAGMATVARQVRPGAPAVEGTSAAELRAELARVRGVLTQSITARQARHRPDPKDLDTELVLCLQAYQDQQRRMALSVDALRVHTRRVLAQGSAGQAQLAALDAAMEQLLGEREQRLLADVPAFLKARWVALRAADAATAGDDAEARSPLQTLQTFNDELEQTLLAELDHRLQPVTGLIESLNA